MKHSIRKGEKRDLPAVLALIQELADFEKAPQEVEVSLNEMEEWGFSEQPLFGFYVAEIDGKVQGMALYYFKYSTWKGKCLFLEDLIVTESLRGKGIGHDLFQTIVALAKQTKVRRLEWQVLEWNAPAIEFYRKRNSVLDEEWINCKLTYDQLQSY
jgi:GNAT superfamily N-acetyltransferase